MKNILFLFLLILLNFFLLVYLNFVLINLIEIVFKSIMIFVSSSIVGIEFFNNGYSLKLIIDVIICGR